MCGIAGSLSHHASDSIDALTDALRHRGPDDRQQWRGSGIALGVQRLAIVDRLRGRQPFQTEGVVMVCNGEIYNHETLRAQLEEKGHQFQTQCDVEVILHGYREWGSGFVRRLQGQFAFAIWDNRKQRLMLARDRYGIVPLAYTRMGGGFTFASEIKALLHVTGVQRTVNRRAVDDYLSMRYAPGPETFFEGIFQLEPGFMLLIDREGGGVSRPWCDPLLPERYTNPFSSPKEAAEELDRLLQVSVDRRFQGDVAKGLYLSGGLDSSVLAHYSQSHSNPPRHYFSHGFDGKTDEIPAARAVAKTLGVHLTEVPLGEDLMGELPQVVSAIEAPVANSDILGLWALARSASQQVKVILCGEGADELFGSYPHQQTLLRLQSSGGEAWKNRIRMGLRFLPPSILKKLGPYSGALTDPLSVDRIQSILDMNYPEDQYRTLTALFSPKEREQLYTREMQREIQEHPGKRAGIVNSLRHLKSQDDLLSAMCEIKMKTFLPDYHLGRENRIAMAFGMEARYPFLDEEIVQTILPLPANFKNGGKPPEKQLLRLVAAKHLPKKIANRPKGPVRVPLDLFSETFDALKAEYLTPRRIRKRGIVRPDAVESLLRKQDLSPFVVQRQLFALVMLEVWFDRFRVSS